LPTLLNGEPAPALADDAALTGGVAAFEALRSYGTEVFGLAAHLARLRASAAWMGLPWPGEGVLVDEIAAVCGGGADRAVTVTLTDQNRVVRAAPLDPTRVGAPLRVATLRWEPPASLPGWVKHTSRAPWLVAARRAGVDEVLLVAADGSWSETNRANLLAVREGRVYSPPNDGRALAGVTRAAMLHNARAVGLEVVEAPMFPGEWDELYVCSTFKELAPIAAVNGAAAVGAGPVGEAIRVAFRRTVGAASDTS
jgi:branched-chain amino acid aminotransferase